MNHDRPRVKQHALIGLPVDLAPTPVDMDTIPPNVVFEVDDANLGLSHYEGKFDLIHARLVSAGLSNFLKTKEDLEKCLKPGGLIIWVEVDYHMIARNMVDYIPLPSETNPAGSWTARLLFGPYYMQEKYSDANVIPYLRIGSSCSSLR